MGHAVADKYQQAMEEWQASGSTSPLEATLADDVVWHEAGLTEAIHGKDAVLQRMQEMGGATPEVTVRSVVGDDRHLSVFGHARFTRNGESCEYDYVEEMDLRDDKVVERWSFMDAVPEDVSRFFAGS